MSQRRTQNVPSRVDCDEEAPSLPAVGNDAVRAAGGQAIAALEAHMRAPSGRESAVERVNGSLMSIKAGELS